MGLSKSKGNMYKFVTHCSTHIEGRCAHDCKYCYVSGTAHARPPKYDGLIRLNEAEFNTQYGEGKTIFVEHCNDIFGPGVKDAWVRRIMAHCCTWPNNTYVFQSKNPKFRRFRNFLPPQSLLGVTIETNRDMTGITKAPAPAERVMRMQAIAGMGHHAFVTIEPILRFDLDELVQMVKSIDPVFVNIGADSKNHGLEEPTIEEVEVLASRIAELGIEVKEKHNMERLRRDG